MAEEEFGVDGLDYIGIDTEIHQFFYTGFEINPNDETVNDFLGFQFEVAAEDDAVFEFGRIFYQWATFV